MATTKKTTDTEPTDDEVWDEVEIGLGKEWDLEHDGTLEGILVSKGSKEVEDKQNGGMRQSSYYTFEVPNDPIGRTFFFVICIATSPNSSAKIANHSKSDKSY